MKMTSISSPINSLNSQSKDIQTEAIFKSYEHLKITDSTHIPPPNVLIRIGGEIISSEGNVTSISGAPKSGKSAFTGIIIAGAIAQGPYDGLPSVDVKTNPGKAVLHFDTEQSRYKHQQNIFTILQRAKVKNAPDYFHSYNIREASVSDYTKITKELVDAAFKKYNGIHLIIIDGLADYIKDVNDPTQSNGIVKFFEDLAIKYKTAVIVIVHQNPGSDKERGHLGSQLQRKSESVLTVKSQGTHSIIEAKFLRMAGKLEFPLIQIMYDKAKGYHVDSTEFVIANREAESQKELNQWANLIFSNVPMRHTEAVNKLMEITSYAMRSSKTKIKEMLELNIISKNSDDLYILNNSEVD